MEVGQKPFECPDASCSLSFANADHLAVHAKKHELSLSLTPTTPFRNLFCDETPTPTRFLNAFGSELFQEFHENPFEATFRKANSSNEASNLVIPESSVLIANLPDSEVLNTPSIMIPAEPETPVILKTLFAKKKTSPEPPPTKPHPSPDKTEDTLPFSPDTAIQSQTSDSIQQQSVSSSNDGASLPMVRKIVLPAVATTSQCGRRKKSIPRTNVVQTPVITSVGNSSILKPVTTGVPTAVVVTRPTPSILSSVPNAQVPLLTQKTSQKKVVPQQAAVVQSMCVTPMVQLMIRLPDGQTMPVQFPMMTQPTNTTSVNPPIAPQMDPEPQPEEPVPEPSAKQKLKEVLKQTIKGKSSSGCRQKGPNLIHILPEPSAQDIYPDFDMPPLSPLIRNGRKRRESSDNPEDKRKRSLERNRAAATRCREKRKMWINALEKKADELLMTNTTLQGEVRNLRNEVNRLKRMLLAHKDCPVTQQQQRGLPAQKAIAQKVRDTYAAIQAVTSQGDDLQCVPNSSPSSSEFMEVELSSVQSSSDISLTSDTSDSSFKER